MPDWDDAVFLPLSGWHSILTVLTGMDNYDPDLFRMMLICGFIGAWRPTQDIVRFDPDVLESLISTNLKGDLPVDILWNLPAWAVYVEAPIELAGKEYIGFMAHLEQDVENGQRELRLLYIGEKEVTPVIVHLLKGSIYQGVAAANAEAKFHGENIGFNLPKEAEQKVEPGLVAAINLLLYLCSYGLSDSEKYEGHKSLPTPIKVKAGWRLFPPDRPKVHVLGESFGRQIREAKAQGREKGEHGTHASPRPHIRRAHWHSFWIGSKKEGGERKILARWLPPMAIAMGEDGEEE